MRMKFSRIIGCVIVIFAVCFVVFAEKCDKPCEKTQGQIKTKSCEKPQAAADVELAKAQLKGEFYKETTGNLKWALGTMVTLFILFLGYQTFRREKEYKEALEGVEKACNDAKAASDKAREYEEEAQKNLAKIDKEVREKLNQIEKRGKESITELINEAKTQREVSSKEAEKRNKVYTLFDETASAYKAGDYNRVIECYGQAVKIFEKENDEFLSEEMRVAIYSNWGASLSKLARLKKPVEAEKLYSQAIEKFTKAVGIKEDYCEAHNNWGASLIYLAELKQKDKPDEAEQLYRQAIEKNAKAVEIKDDYCEAYNNWSNALSGLAKLKRKGSSEQSALLEEAKKIALKAESIKAGSASYNLGCVWALLGDKGECKKWLKVGEEAKTLPTREHAESDDDLKSVWNEDWFKKIRWEGEK